MADSGNDLFNDHRLDDIIREKWKEIHNEISIKDRVTLSNIEITELIEYFKSKYALTSPVLREEEIRRNEEDIRLEIDDYVRRIVVDGIQIAIYIPFEGDYHIFRYRPMSFNHPINVRANVNSKEIILLYQKKRSNDHLELISSEYKVDLSVIRQNLEAMGVDVKTFNDSIGVGVTSQYNDRIRKITEDNKKMEELGFPIRRRADVPSFLEFPQKKKVISFPAPSKEKDTFEPSIQMEVYNEIIATSRDMSLVMERSPAIFSKMDEENIRDLFLVILNGVFEGQATGETFNFGGKTDILVRVMNKNVFIGECKFWDGPKSLLAAIDQLLSYASWRDTKTAIILFNKTKNFTHVLEKILTTVRDHSNYIRELEKPNETEFRFKIHHRDDKSRELFLAILAFEVPS